MSAVNVFLDAERAVVLTDGATYQPDGTLLSIGRKCWPVKGCKAVVTGRGPGFFAPSFAKTVADYIDDIDDIEQRGETLIDRCIEAAQDAGYLKAEPKIDLFVIGWSEVEGRPKCAQFTTCAPEGVDRFSMVDSVMSPGLDSSAIDAVTRAVGQQDRTAIEYGRLGIALMEEQRRLPGKIFAPGQFLVGGHILRTDITAKGITQREIHHWSEDRVGQKIRPAPRLDAAAHPNVTTLLVSRAERRRQEKLQRKGAA